MQKVGNVKKSLMDEFSDKAIGVLVKVVLRWLVRLGRKKSEAKRGLTDWKIRRVYERGTHNECK